ncbi:SMC1 [Symbiodinium sp. CCMP2592]|nr:SMC1 [Symbiodinium sp. CCMP2592]
MADTPASMARVEKLVIENFKSYAGRHEIGPFDKFTCIIGPNGSGKSNVMDAISFCLGIKTKHLRGERLKDLVYRREEETVDQNTRSAEVVMAFRSAKGIMMYFGRFVTSRGEGIYRYGGDQAPMTPVSYEEYSRKLAGENIFVRARSFLVFQGDVMQMARRQGTELTATLEALSGSELLKDKYIKLSKELELAQEKARLHFQHRREAENTLALLASQRAEVKRYQDLKAQRDALIVEAALFRLYAADREAAQNIEVSSGLRTEVAEAEAELRKRRKAIEEADAQRQKFDEEFREAQNEHFALKTAMEQQKPEIASCRKQALTERLANRSRAWSAAAEEAADEPAPKFRIELQRPCKCLQFAVKWDPDMRNMINCLKEEGEEALTPFFESEVFIWKLRKYVRNMVSSADRLNLKRDVIQRRQQRELNERTAQKTAEQEMQDRQALLELFGQVDQPVAAAQAPVVQEQAPLVAPSEKPAASIGVPVVEEAEDAPDPFLEMLAKTSQKKPTDSKMSPEDAAALASMMAEGPKSSLTEAGEAPKAFGQVLTETSQEKPVEAPMSMASMMAENPPSSRNEAPQDEQSAAGESADAFMTMLMETSRKKLTDTQMTPEDAAAMAAMMAAEQPLKAEAPDVHRTLSEISEKKPIDAQLSQEDAAALACLMAEEPASNSTETPQEEEPSAEESACNTDGWEGEDFFAHIDSSLPPEEAAVKLFAAMGISADLAFVTSAPVVPTNTMESQDPFKNFWDSLDDNMSPELVAAKLVHTAQFVNAY